MGRPRGELRTALRAALADGAGTGRELAARCVAGLEATQYTLRDMCRAGEVCKPRTVRVPGVRRPVPVYELATDQPVESPGADLAAALQSWR